MIITHKELAMKNESLLRAELLLKYLRKKANDSTAAVDAASAEPKSPEPAVPQPDPSEPLTDPHREQQGSGRKQLYL
jgi:hypothetical protein